MSSPTELVRVKDPRTGVEYNASRIHAKNAGLTVLDKPTRDRYGREVPVKPDPLRTTEKPKATQPNATNKTTNKTTAKAADKKES